MVHKLVFLFFIVLSWVTFAEVPKTWSGVDFATSQSTPVSLQSPGKMGLVLVFLSVKCPCSNSHVGELKELAKKYPQFRFVAVHSNSDESYDLAKDYFKGLDLPFMAIQDEKAKIADELKAYKTPHVYVFGSSGETLYKGGVTSSSNAPTAEKHYLADVLLELSSGRTLKVTETRTLGCVIARENDNKNIW